MITLRTWEKEKAVMSICSSED